MTPPEPTRRADATRNRDRILEAARAAFADPAADVSMIEIARRAGVGSATLYRNFASRRELLEALYVDEVDALVDAAGADADTPGDELIAWARSFYAYFASKRHVASALLEHADPDDPFFSTGRSRVIAAGTPLLAAAQQAGEIRPDLSLGQVLDLVGAVAKVSDDDAYRAPILEAVLDGLRTHPADR
ncbi:MAG: TetR/AcrR family transcriptional regulator [Solirubrobacteraceae bacterium]|nr:TetR/AcrR family transcriptional regulator [Solirubrobacteraceae bacterium]